MHGLKDVTEGLLPWSDRDGPVDKMRAREALRYYGKWKEQNSIPDKPASKGLMSIFELPEYEKLINSVNAIINALVKIG